MLKLKNLERAGMDLRSKSVIIFILLLMSYVKVQAYPLFFKCDKEGHLSDMLTDPEFLDQLRSFAGATVASQKAAIATICEGSKQCESELSNIINLVFTAKNGGSNGTQEKALGLARARAEAQKRISGIVEVDPKTFGAFKEFARLGENLRTCRAQITKLTADQFLLGDALLLYHPYHNNYIHITGCKGLNGECELISADRFRDVIRNAVAMDIDPYAMLAIATMEIGSTSINSLYLDPIGKFGVMGCKGKQVSADQEGALESYGNYHVIKPEVLPPNSGLEARLKSYLQINKFPISEGKSYFCRGITDSEGVFLKAPKESQCCSVMNYSTKYESTLDDAFAYEFARQKMYSSIGADLAERAGSKRAENEPAYRLQRFNGYSEMMGGGESVATYLAGANFYESPSYGYQSMDYIVNSLMTNPAVRQMVEDEKKKQNKDFKSILCTSRSEGTFVLDSDYYMNKVRDTPRLTKIAGKPYDQITGRARIIIDQELLFLRESRTDYNLPDDNNQALAKYWKDIYPGRNTLGRASGYQSGKGYSWERLTTDQIQRLGQNISSTLKDENGFYSPSTTKTTIGN